MNDFANSLFWTEVSGEHELQQRTSALAHGKVAVSSYWPFLASAESERDFENRLEIVSARLETLVDPDVLPDVLSGLRDDYRLVKGASDNPFAKDDDDDKSEGDKKNDDEADDASDKAEDETGTDNDDDDSDDKSKDDGDDDDSNDDDQDDKDKSGQPSWLNKKNKDESDTGKNASKTAGQYIPDPSDKDRYYPPYANLETLPLNNGDLQGPDGYIKDIAEGEQRTPEAYARQTTPGTWSLGDGMSERPMPQGVERGYHPVASVALDHYSNGYHHGLNPSNSYPPQQVMQGYDQHHGEGSSIHYLNGYDDARTELDARRNRVHSSLAFDADGFVVEGNQYIKQQGGQWVITQKGTGKVLSHHDSQEKANEAFSAMESNMHSHGSLVFDADGFVVTSLVDPPPGAPLKANPYYFDQGSAGLAGMSFPTSPSQDPEDDRVNEYGDVAPQMSSGSTEGQNDGNGYSRSQPGREASYRFNSDGTLTTVSTSGQVKTTAPEPRNFNEAPEGMIWVKWDKTSATDGKFVKHCPGCDVPLRLHTTLHGDELHHVTHDGVRCHGGDAKTAQHLPSGSNIAGFDHSLSFAEGLIYNQGYGIHNAAEFFPSFLAAGDYVSRPGADDPTGRGDDWSARTWDAGANTRPLQSAEDRGVNTPVRSSDPIRTRNIGGGNPQLDRSRTDHMEMSGNGDEDDD